MVNFNTWSQTVSGVVKESVLDHIYVVNPYCINELASTWQTYTDHSLVSFMLNQKTIANCAILGEIVKKIPI